MSEHVASLADLPLDILVLIFPYLDPKSFLSLCSTCKSFQQNSIRLDPAYWSHAVHVTFRVPNQPVVQHDGERWQKMYRRLLTQSRAYTWGSTTSNRLGHSFEQAYGPERIHGFGRRTLVSSHCSFPTEMNKARELGIIADMQCGGWSTTILNSKGKLYIVGILDGQSQGVHTTADGPEALKYPPGFPQPDSYTEPSTAIRQFSSGRSHVLGLSDSGKIWSWYHANEGAVQVKFWHVDVKEDSTTPSSTTSNFGRVKKVVAGWSTSSAYIYGAGIVLWAPVSRPADQDPTDTVVTEGFEVAKTNYQRTKNTSRESEEVRAIGEEVGAVLNYIVLEHFVVFTTDNGKVFAGRMEANKVPEIMELRSLRNENGNPSDVQGSFRSFAAFKMGEVITAHQDYLEACWNARHENTEQNDIEGLKRIPALQHNDVIQLAFGDYHFLALHSTGKITSYGKELQGCGALGLGGDGDPEGRTRGIRYIGFGHDGKLLPHAYTHGRQVWFEHEKKKWITFMTSGGKDPEEAKERMRMFVTDPNVQGEVSEWFEQEGRDWDKWSEVKDADEDGLGSYFTLGISAAGWHSGALVLVNESLAQRVREQCIVKDPQVELEREEVDASGPSSSSLLAATSNWVSDTTRWFLGLPSADQQQPSPNLQAALDRHARPGPNVGFLDPIQHGASPEKGYKYTWAEKPFPRLRLSDGTEMPGEVDFDEWRFGRPEWNLDVDI